MADGPVRGGRRSTRSRLATLLWRRANANEQSRSPHRAFGSVFAYRNDSGDVAPLGIKPRRARRVSTVKSTRILIEEAGQRRADATCSRRLWRSALVRRRLDFPGHVEVTLVIFGNDQSKIYG